MSLGFRREVRGRDIHWGIVETEMVFKAKKLEAVVGVERKKEVKTRTPRNCNVSRPREVRKTVEDQPKDRERGWEEEYNTINVVFWRPSDESVKKKGTIILDAAARLGEMLIWAAWSRAGPGKSVSMVPQGTRNGRE